MKILPRNLLKIPRLILDRLKTFDQDDIVAATVKLVPPESVAHYEALGVSIANGELDLPEPAPPPASAGRYSDANLYGKERARRDLQKKQKEYGFHARSWRSSSYHYVSWTREVFQREFLPPKQVNLTVELVGERGSAFILKFAVDQVISRRTPNFEQDLLYNLNLLQENVGAAGIYASSARHEDYAATMSVDWEILPPGSVDEVFAAITAGRQLITPAQADVMKQRLQVMSGLKPTAFVAGTQGFLRYFGAMFGDDFVAFENLQYGNAIYLMSENWKSLSQRSRVELLAGDPDSFVRIIHRPGWIEQLTERVRDYRRKRQPPQCLLF